MIMLQINITQPRFGKEIDVGAASLGNGFGATDIATAQIELENIRNQRQPLKQKTPSIAFLQGGRKFKYQIGSKVRRGVS
mmetsp:Transcript_26137/g.57576  ORF Transcript_26137/g.57576 Transcript_26137/m.57576 type:complete len:80 (+) Transcript_26137:860-1099(+)